MQSLNVKCTIDETNNNFVKVPSMNNNGIGIRNHSFEWVEQEIPAEQ